MGTRCRPGGLGIRRSTFFGRVSTRELVLASEALFTAPLDVDYRQDGCVRYRYVPAGSRTPRRFRSQPDLALAEALAGVDEPGWAGLHVPRYRIRRDRNAPSLETQGAEGGDFRCICATQSLPFSVERRLSVVLKRNIQGACMEVNYDNELRGLIDQLDKSPSYRRMQG